MNNENEMLKLLGPIPDLEKMDKKDTHAYVKNLHTVAVTIEENRQKLIKRPLDYSLRNYALGLVVKQLNISNAKEFEQCLEYAYKFQKAALEPELLKKEQEERLKLV